MRAPMDLSPKRRIIRRVNQAPQPVHQQRFQSKRRLFLNGSLIMLLLSLLFWGGQKLFDPNFLPLRAVRIEGNYSHVDKKLLQKTTLSFARKGFLGVSTSVLKERLEALPWVHSANIWRVWPDTLHIHLEEQQVIARWGQSDLLNTKGELFHVAPKAIPKGLPILEGPNGQQKITLQYYRDMSRLLTPLGLQITVLSLTARHAWQLRLNNGMLVILGRDEPLVRLARFVKVYRQLFAIHDKTVEYVDLRYSHGLAVKWSSTLKTQQYEE